MIINLKDYTKINIELDENTDRQMLTDLIQNECNNNSFIKVTDINDRIYVINADEIVSIDVD